MNDDTKSGIRLAHAGEVEELSELAMRSKAHWGYDEAFMEACRDELTLTPAYLEANPTFVLEDDGRVVGLASLEALEQEGDVELGMLFVDPGAIGCGGRYGSRLFEHSCREARRRGFRSMWIQSDPDAEGFYRRLGAVTVSRKESRSLPGRMLPWMRFGLAESGLSE